MADNPFLRYRPYLTSLLAQHPELAGLFEELTQLEDDDVDELLDKYELVSPRDE